MGTRELAAGHGEQLQWEAWCLLVFPTSGTAAASPRQAHSRCLAFGLPYRSLVLVRVSPSALLAALNNGLSGYTGDSTAGGRFPQIAGMRLAFNPSAVDKFARLLDLRLTTAGAPAVADLPTDIIVITNNFMASGGDG